MTKEQLRQHRRMIREIRLEMRQLIETVNGMRDRATKVTTVYSSEPRGGGQCSDPIAELVARVADKDREIARLDVLRDQLADEVEKEITALTPAERFVIRAYYVDCLDWDKVILLSNYCERQVFRIHGDALAKMAVKCS